MQKNKKCDECHERKPDVKMRGYQDCEVPLCNECAEQNRGFGQEEAKEAEGESEITRESYGNALLTLQRRLSDSSNKLCLETILLYVGQLESKLNQRKSCEEAAQSYGEKVSARHNGYLHPVEEATEGFKKGFAYAVTLLEKCHSIRHFLNDERYVGFGEAIEELICELK